ncbi:Importin-beta protein [Ancylostoma ceylanicum]|uniref:Importin-beta protein n=1 Tax=Ancylostoma ceylanicum TaxID=53326 RepID=A0A0D6LEB5_9BILA|nr:Importin-beta protein [Ancylostoma ceylanicum]
MQYMGSCEVVELVKRCLCSKQRGFTPELLNIACDASIAEPIRQAAVIYFKNTVVRLWEVDDESEEKTENAEHCLSDEDKALVKAGILDAVCAASESLRFKRNKDRDDIAGPVSKLEPFVYYHCHQLLNNQSAGAILIQIQGLKIIYVLTQFSIHFGMLAVPRLDEWIKFSIDILARECPPELDSIEDKDERAHTVWWKCKKWAAKILDRVFDRYGSPNQVEKQYSEFANHFLTNWSRPALETMLMILNAHRNGIYVSDRELIKTVLFRLMSYTKADEEMWEDNAPEYVRFKYTLTSYEIKAEYASVGGGIFM